jgi:hypothetical protein
MVLIKMNGAATMLVASGGPLTQRPSEEAVMPEAILRGPAVPVNWPWMIPITKGYSVLVDEADLEPLSRVRWKALVVRGKVYASRTITTRLEVQQYRMSLMHRVIVGAEKGQCVDHWNGNGLDNRRENLRICTPSQNSSNRISRGGTSRFKGVYWNKEKAKWQAAIGVGKANGKQRMLYLGRFVDEEMAARAYDRKAFEMHGEFAVLNFPSDAQHEKPIGWRPPDIAGLLATQGRIDRG